MKPTTDELIKELRKQQDIIKENAKNRYSGFRHGEALDIIKDIIPRLQGRLDILEENHFKMCLENVNHNYPYCTCVFADEIAKIKDALGDTVPRAEVLG